MLDHYEKTNHRLVMDPKKEYSVWCYECDTAVDPRHEAFESIISALRRGEPPIPDWTRTEDVSLAVAHRALVAAHHSCSRPDLALKALHALEVRRKGVAVKGQA